MFVFREFVIEKFKIGIRNSSLSYHFDFNEMLFEAYVLQQDSPAHRMQ